MSGVIAEFTIEATDFAFGDALLTDPSMEVIIERMVPTGQNIMPYVWVRNGDFDEFERVVADDKHVIGLTVIEELDGERLYRVDWTEDVRSLIYGINASNGTILEASGHESWEFVIRFPEHDDLRTFYNYTGDESITLHLDRLYDLTERRRNGVFHRITSQQREALAIACEMGYFQVPRAVSLIEIAEELGISDQACSERLRRGTEHLVCENVS